MTGDDRNGWEEQIRGWEEQIRQTAKRIDPYTARMVSWYAQTFDPYGLEPDPPDELQCLGREYFLVNPKEKDCAVLVEDVRELHPEIPDEEWNELMRTAAARDDSFDPCSFFHGYRSCRGGSLASGLLALDEDELGGD